MDTSDRQALPPLFPRHVRRPRLTRLLDETKAQVIVLTAPAGYGKTTLAAEWLQQRENVAWYRATEASADVAAFAADVAKSMGHVTPIGRRLEQTLKVAHVPSDPGRRLAELLAEDARGWPDDALVVLDDFHLAATRTVNRFIDWLISLSPLKLVVTTRRHPPWLTARRVLHGEIFSLETDQLAMRADEAAEVLRGLSRRSVRALLDSAEGWPALIGLGAVASNASLPEQRVAGVLYAYLAEEIWRSEAAPVREFMLSASVLPSIEAKACEALLERSDADRSITELRARGLLHDFGGRDHFHPLLRAFLREKLQERPETARDLVRRAIDFSRSRRAWDNAFSIAVESGEYRTAVGLISHAAPDLLRAGRIETLESWISSCAAAAYEPRVMLVQAQILIRRGRLTEARAIAEDILARTSPDPEQTSLAYLFAAQAAHLMSDSVAVFRFHCAARDASTSMAIRRDALWGAFVAAVELDQANLEMIFHELIESSDSHLDSRLRVEIARFLVSERTGSLAGIWARAHHIVALASRASDPMIGSDALMNFASLNLVRGDFSTARRLAEEAVDFARSLELDFAVGFGLAAKAEAEIAMRALSDAQRTIRELADAVATQEDPHLVVTLETLRLKLGLTDSSRVGELETEDSFHGSTVPRTPYAEYLALQSLILAGMDRFDEASRRAHRARGYGNSATTQFFVTWSELICSGLSDKTDSCSMAAVEGVVEDARKRECLGCVVWAYRSCPRLLGLIRPWSSAARTLRPLIKVAADDGLSLRLGLSWFGAAADDPLGALTEREREVYPLIVEGLSNREIAQRLFISTSTAKVHVHHVLRKLGKASRVELRLKAL